MKQQVTVAMMRMPTNKAEDTPITKGMRRRSAAGRREKKEGRMHEDRRTTQQLLKNIPHYFLLKEGKHSRVGER